MTTLYRPVLIESAEQAEALPVGTVAYLPGFNGWVTPAAKVGPSDWRSGDDDPGTRDRTMVDWTALVPIEAEEELVEKRRLCQKDPDILHRYVTGWQHYTAKEQNR